MHFIRPTRTPYFLALLIGGSLAWPVHAVVPKPEEFAACRAWSERRLDAAAAAEQFPYVQVLFEDAADSVTRGKSWRGTPFQLGDKQYAHGLAFNSTKHLLVRVGKPSDRFTAEIGLENNDDTRRGEAQGSGSVTFHVLVNGTEVFTSPVRRRKDGAMRLNVPLQGASEFEIRVKDGGDGRGWDQALWAEAEVWRSDGTRLRLQDIPSLASKGVNPYLVSFKYGGTNSASLLAQWQTETRDNQLDAKRSQREIVYRDPTTGLELRLEAVRFQDFPAVEWVARFTNAGSNNTPLLENIQAWDGLLPIIVSENAVLHWAKGGVASFDDFAPQTALLNPGNPARFQPGGGRSSSQVLPFFNVEGATGGLMLAVGWTGEWAAEFDCPSKNEVTFKAGLERTHLTLHPGESIRTPRMLALFYEGDWWRGQNLLRQFLLAHHRPTVNGQPLVAPITSGNWGGTRAAVHLDNIRQIVENQLPLDYYWIDAEWYGQGSWPVNVGTWEVKKDLYPNGFKPLSDALRASKRELMLWFEPERVFKGTAWHKSHPEWLLQAGGDNLLWNLGDPKALAFLTDFISSKVKEFGLGCYRQDFNMDPLPIWRATDAPDRVGLSEIRHIEGLYAFWDGLVAQNPGLILDNCASGGRRIDLETTGRATPFWRTDGPRDAIAHQCHTYGLLSWIPLSATSQDRAGDDYEFRSSMCSSLCLNWWITGDAPAEPIPADFPFAWAKATLAQYLKIRPFYYGDYYPITAYSQADHVWMAYQLDRPDLGKGVVVALRRPRSPYESARLALRGLEAKANYKVTNLDTWEERTYPAFQLSDGGLPVAVPRQPGSTLLLYEKK
jgi:alpha-galactosidase